VFNVTVANPQLSGDYQT